jgi:hypothetical protein
VPETRRAWLDGALVVIGAAIAAVAGVVGPLALQDREDHRLDRREAQAARGAARVMLADFVEADVQMKALENDRILRRFDAPKRVELPQLVAEKLDGDTWGTVQVALTNVAALATFVKSLIQRGRRRLTDAAACFVRADVRAIGYATGILGANLGGNPADAPRPPTVDCGTTARPYGISLNR